MIFENAIKLEKIQTYNNYFPVVDNYVPDENSNKGMEETFKEIIDLRKKIKVYGNKFDFSLNSIEHDSVIKKMVINGSTFDVRAYKPSDAEGRLMIELVDDNPEKCCTLFVNGEPIQCSRFCLNNDFSISKIWLTKKGTLPNDIEYSNQQYWLDHNTIRIHSNFVLDEEDEIQKDMFPETLEIRSFYDKSKPFKFVREDGEKKSDYELVLDQLQKDVGSLKPGISNDTVLINIHGNLAYCLVDDDAGIKSYLIQYKKNGDHYELKKTLPVGNKMNINDDIFVNDRHVILSKVRVRGQNEIIYKEMQVYNNSESDFKLLTTTKDKYYSNRMFYDKNKKKYSFYDGKEWDKEIKKYFDKCVKKEKEVGTNYLPVKNSNKGMTEIFEEIIDSGQKVKVHGNEFDFSESNFSGSYTTKIKINGQECEVTHSEEQHGDGRMFIGLHNPEKIKINVNGEQIACTGFCLNDDFSISRIELAKGGRLFNKRYQSDGLSEIHIKNNFVFDKEKGEMRKGDFSNSLTIRYVGAFKFVRKDGEKKSDYELVLDQLKNDIDDNKISIINKTPVALISIHKNLAYCLVLNDQRKYILVQYKKNGDHYELIKTIDTGISIDQDDDIFVNDNHVIVSSMQYDDNAKVMQVYNNSESDFKLLTTTKDKYYSNRMFYDKNKKKYSFYDGKEWDKEIKKYFDKCVKKEQDKEKDENEKQKKEKIEQSEQPVNISVNYIPDKNNNKGMKETFEKIIDNRQKIKVHGNEFDFSATPFDEWPINKIKINGQECKVKFDKVYVYGTCMTAITAKEPQKIEININGEKIDCSAFVLNDDFSIASIHLLSGKGKLSDNIRYDTHGYPSEIHIKNNFVFDKEKGEMQKGNFSNSLTIRSLGEFKFVREDGEEKSDYELVLNQLKNDIRHDRLNASKNSSAIINIHGNLAYCLVDDNAGTKSYLIQYKKNGDHYELIKTIDTGISIDQDDDIFVNDNHVIVSSSKNYGNDKEMQVYNNSESDFKLLTTTKDKCYSNRMFYDKNKEKYSFYDGEEWDKKIKKYFDKCVEKEQDKEKDEEKKIQHYIDKNLNNLDRDNKQQK